MTIEQALTRIVEQNDEIASLLRAARAGEGRSSVEIQTMTKGEPPKITIKAYAPNGGEPTDTQLYEAISAAEQGYAALKRDLAEGKFLEAPKPEFEPVDEA